MSIKLGGTTNGVKIHVYFNEHNPPHVHLQYGGEEVRICLEEPFWLLDEPQSFPKQKLKLGINYVRENHERLLRNFFKVNPNLDKNEISKDKKHRSKK